MCIRDRDYLVKPIQKDVLLHKVRSHLKTNTRWQELQQNDVPWNDRILPFDFLQFKESLFDQFNLKVEERDKFSKVPPAKIYSMSADLGIENRQMAQYIARFLQLTYLPYINPEDVQLSVLPTPFCRTNLVLAVGDVSGEMAFVLSNPFNWELLNTLKKSSGRDRASKLMITEPENIAALFIDKGAAGSAKPGVGLFIAGKKDDKVARPVRVIPEKLSEPEIEKHPVLHMANNIIDKAVSERASDIHIEPKETNTIVRFRIDGDMRETLALKKDTGVMLISRFKALGGMDIAERRKPQDGSLEVIIEGRTFQLRLATTSTPDGESLIIRLLEPLAKPKKLQELGMIHEQVSTMIEFANQTRGLILIVGPTGSGKTTTIYSLLSQIDCKTRSLISVEDPVEYRIPYANQQQVNAKAGITFESLLKSAMRQDPDIIFLGEVRDSFSAKAAVDFASTGHLTVTTLHTANATTAIFRLERLGVDRGTMADTILGVVAQRLLKKLCPHCKEIVPISNEEAAMLSPFTREIPSQAAHPVGCPKCHHTGYYGREGIYEIMQFDPEISKRVRSHRPISEIRTFARERGDYLICDHAVKKVKELLFSPKDVYEKVLVEEVQFQQDTPAEKTPKTVLLEKPADHRPAILVVEDDKVTRVLIQRLVENQGYEVTLAEDGIDALLQLGKKDFALILSDINMPNLDGLKLLDMMNQKGIETPVIFLTAQTSEEKEIKGFELGAADYLKKPIQKDILLLRVKSVLDKRSKREAKNA